MSTTNGGQFYHAITNQNSPTLADVKQSLVDPLLVKAGLDPAQYQLVYELGQPVLAELAPAVQTATEELDRAAQEAIRSLARALDLPAGLIDPYDPEAVAWRARREVAESWAQSQREFYPTWRYVSGGRAYHAFLDGAELPVCGVDPRRGRDRRPARWTEIDVRARLRWGGRHEHELCRKLVRQHQLDLVGRAP